MKETPQDANKALVNDYLEMFNERDEVGLSERLADSVVYRGEEKPGEDVLEGTQKLWKAFPDYKVTIEEMIGAEGDRVVVRERAVGTHKGEFRGIEATGNEIDVNATIVYGVEEGQIAEMWGDWDEFGLYEQLGMVERPIKD